MFQTNKRRLFEKLEKLKQNCSSIFDSKEKVNLAAVESGRKVRKS